MNHSFQQTNPPQYITSSQAELLQSTSKISTPNKRKHSSSLPKPPPIPKSKPLVGSSSGSSLNSSNHSPSNSSSNSNTGSSSFIKELRTKLVPQEEILNKKPASPPPEDEITFTQDNPNTSSNLPFYSHYIRNYNHNYNLNAAGTNPIITTSNTTIASTRSAQSPTKRTKASFTSNEVFGGLLNGPNTSFKDTTLRKPTTSSSTHNNTGSSIVQNYPIIPIIASGFTKRTTSPTKSSHTAMIQAHAMTLNTGSEHSGRRQSSTTSLVPSLIQSKTLSLHLNHLDNINNIDNTNKTPTNPPNSTHTNNNNNNNNNNTATLFSHQTKPTTTTTTSTITNPDPNTDPPPQHPTDHPIDPSILYFDDGTLTFTDDGIPPDPDTNSAAVVAPDSQESSSNSNSEEGNHPAEEEISLSPLISPIGITPTPKRKTEDEERDFRLRRMKEEASHRPRQPHPNYPHHQNTAKIDRDKDDSSHKPDTNITTRVSTIITSKNKRAESNDSEMGSTQDILAGLFGYISPQQQVEVHKEEDEEEQEQEEEQTEPENRDSDKENDTEWMMTTMRKAVAVPSRSRPPAIRTANSNNEGDRISYYHEESQYYSIQASPFELVTTQYSSSASSNRTSFILPSRSQTTQNRIQQLNNNTTNINDNNDNNNTDDPADDFDIHDSPFILVSTPTHNNKNNSDPNNNTTNNSSEQSKHSPRPLLTPIPPFSYNFSNTKKSDNTTISDSNPSSSISTSRNINSEFALPKRSTKRVMGLSKTALIKQRNNSSTTTDNNIATTAAAATSSQSSQFVIDASPIVLVTPQYVCSPILLSGNPPNTSTSPTSSNEDFALESTPGRPSPDL